MRYLLRLYCTSQRRHAQLMCRLGAAMTVIERSIRLLPRKDPDVSHSIRPIPRPRGCASSRAQQASREVLAPHSTPRRRVPAF